jgi:hypothetical protein
LGVLDNLISGSGELGNCFSRLSQPRVCFSKRRVRLPMICLARLSVCFPHGKSKTSILDGAAARPEFVKFIVSVSSCPQ